MNIQNPPDAQAYYLDGLTKIEHEIIEKSASGEFLYRGEPECYKEAPYRGKVSSTLSRQIPDGFDSEGFSLTKFQEEELKEVRNYTHENQKEDFELLTELQHYGSSTNLIDFTTDYHIALYFACDGSHDKDGRVILLKRNEETKEKYNIEKPQTPLNRVIAQKSEFAQPPQGFIEFKDINVVCVPRHLKQWILMHLRKFQDISTQSVYNDLHGYIRHKALSSSKEAIVPLVLADLAKELAEENSSAEEQKDSLERAISNYTEAIQYSPYDATTYVKQGECYMGTGKFENAIETLSKAIFLRPDHADDYYKRGLAYLGKEAHNLAIADFSRAIELNPDHGGGYFYRAMVRLDLEEWEDARFDLTTAKEKGIDIATEFKNSGFQPGDFKGLKGSSLPKDLARMFESRQ